MPQEQTLSALASLLGKATFISDIENSQIFSLSFEAEQEANQCFALIRNFLAEGKEKLVLKIQTDKVLNASSHCILLHETQWEHLKKQLYAHQTPFEIGDVSFMKSLCNVDYKPYRDFMKAILSESPLPLPRSKKEKKTFTPLREVVFINDSQQQEKCCKHL